MSFPKRAVRLMSSVLLFAVLSFGQSFTGRIVGTVTDASGAVVAGAEVPVLNVATNWSLTTTSNEDGNYTLTEIPRGEYQVEVSSTGFKQFVRRGIQLSVGQQARVDVRLEVGSVAESVEVSPTPRCSKRWTRSSARSSTTSASSNCR
jgi:hypothetical protein